MVAKESKGTSRTKVTSRTKDRDADNRVAKKKRGIESLSVERLRSIIPTVANKNRRRIFSQRLRLLSRQAKTKKRRTNQAAEARGEKIEKGTPRTIENLRVADETIGECE